MIDKRKIEIKNKGFPPKPLSPAIDATRLYYTEHSKEYISRTRGFDLSGTWQLGLKYFSPESRILDLGCGSGRDMRFFGQRGYLAIGLDFSAPLAASARRFSEQEVVVGSFRRLPFKNNSFDGIWSIASLLHIPRTIISDVLIEIHRVLRPGGIFISSIKLGSGQHQDQDGKLFVYYSVDAWSEIVEGAGFKTVVLVEDTEEREKDNQVIVKVPWLVCVAGR
jgi:SAM-dependent methyltransferase